MKRLVLCLGIATSTVVLAADAPRQLPALNSKVVEFAKTSLGKKVGDGECISLARFALAHAGAKQYRLNDPKGDYAWGQRIGDFKDALPGDILQFRDAEFKGKKWVTKRRWISWYASYPHHTAIVSEVKERGNLVSVLHQNVGGDGADAKEKQTVREDTLRIDSLQPGGWIRIYRPVADVADEEP